MDLIQGISLPRIVKDHTGSVIFSTFAASAILYSTYCGVFKGDQKKIQGTKEIPIPSSKYPYIGHFLSLGELPARTIEKWHNELGPIVKLQMGRQTWISVNCPILAQKIFVTHGAETSYRPHTIFTQDYHSMNGKGMIFAQPGPSWKKCRTAALSILAPKQIHNYMGTIHRESSYLVDSLIDCTKKEGSVDPLKYLELNSLNVICAASYGHRFDSIHDPEYEKTATLVKQGLKFAGYEDDLGNFLPIPSMFDSVLGKQAKYRKYIKQRNAAFRLLIKEAASKNDKNLVKSLEENKCGLTEDDTLVLMFELTMGGMDTTATAISWDIATLCHYPDVQEKIAAEIDDFIRVHNRLPEFKDRENLPYSISVMKECMRHRPISPFGAAHTVEKDIEIGGYIIPKGCILLPNLECMHRNPERFPEPEKFMPDRFINNLKTMQSATNGKFEDRDHYNFGFGRRACPGIYLAEVEVFSAFVELFSRCSIKPVSESQMPDIRGAVNAGLVTTPLPFRVQILKRESALL